MPSVRYHVVTWNGTGYEVLEGIAILSTDGAWTYNYPDLHNLNGIAKRTRTARRFKKVVRIFKRLRADMTDRGLLKVSVPSFLVECLVYCVEDSFFLVEEDDRYDRVKRIAVRMLALLDNPLVASTLKEINGIKPLFGTGQAWSRPDAITFVRAAIAHLGDA